MDLQSFLELLKILVTIPLTILVIAAVFGVLRSLALSKLNQANKNALMLSANAIGLSQKPFDMNAASAKKRRLNSLTRSFVAEVVQQQLVYKYYAMQDDVLAITQKVGNRYPDSLRYLEDLIRFTVRNGLASDMIRDCLKGKGLSEKSLYFVIKENFSQLAEDEFSFLEIECNQPGRRFNKYFEQDMFTISLLLLVESTFMRTPTSICYYLCYTSGQVRLHILDNDDSETGLDLQVKKDKWPENYKAVHNIASHYQGYLSMDPTVTKGVSIEVNIPIPEWAGED
ncbi:hypothetical protein AB9P05_08575 [Roseivirga sp. BDSF3-8]|uniref:hypothetical protein n=1 Tax=Roseivirga sp. BDSF3-8 TaxID=3241598 RepID=UPI0035320741